MSEEEREFLWNEADTSYMNEPDTSYMSDAKREEFEKAVDAVIKYLCENHHPHTSVYIDCTHAELSEGCMCYVTEEHIKD